jgi:hypothetical protein
MSEAGCCVTHRAAANEQHVRNSNRPNRFPIVRQPTHSVAMHYICRPWVSLDEGGWDIRKEWSFDLAIAAAGRYADFAGRTVSRVGGRWPGRGTQWAPAQSMANAY